MIFDDKRVVVSTVLVTEVDGGFKKTPGVVLFDGLGDYWATSKKDLKETDRSRQTNVEFKDVTIPQYVNTIAIDDTVELFDINSTSIGKFIVYEVDKRPSLGGYTQNTFIRVSSIDG